MKTLYFDCFSGISGDMTLAALSDLCGGFDYLKEELSKLSVKDEFSLESGYINKGGVDAFFVEVIDKHCHDHHSHSHGRCLLDITEIINSSGITENAKNIAKNIFNIVARAEASVHGVLVDEIHFHEVGAVDSIVDIIGTAILIDKINPDLILSSELCDGKGQVKCAHGILPVPVPATLEILKFCSVPFEITNEKGEMTTPTGAGIIAALAEGFYSPKGILKSVGKGGGKKDFIRPNVLRVMLFEDFENINEDTVTMLETNLDDSTGEAIGLAQEELFKHGALDVFLTPVYMKKNRPGVILSVIAKDNLKKLEEIIFTHTTALGIRRQNIKRTVLQREIVKVNTEYGDINVKVSLFNGIKKIAPEYEDVKKLVNTFKLPFNTIYQDVIEAAGKAL